MPTNNDPDKREEAPRRPADESTGTPPAAAPTGKERPTARRHRLLPPAVVATARLLLAAAFLFSGFVKAVDPMGLQIKLADYVAALGLDTLLTPGWLWAAALLLPAAEFCMALYLFFGIWRSLVTFLFLLAMALFTPFTLYLALANPVDDCGCFGDALPLSNWQSFGKNLLLLLCAVALFAARRRLYRFISGKCGWMVSLYSLLFILAVELIGIQHQPLIDFRPYHVGADMRQGREGEPPLVETLFVMEKEGEQREFSQNEYPDSSWHFVSRRSVVLSPGRPAPMADLLFADPHTGDELTDEILADTLPRLLLIAPSLDQADRRSVDKINDLYDYAAEQGYPFWCATASVDAEIERWRSQTGADYPFLQADGTLLKTIARANPALLLIKEGVILGKWSSATLPDIAQFRADLRRRQSVEPAELHRRQLFGRLVRIALLFFVPLLLFRGIDLLANIGRKKKEKEQAKSF